MTLRKFEYEVSLDIFVFHESHEIFLYNLVFRCHLMCNEM